MANGTFYVVMAPEFNNRIIAVSDSELRAKEISGIYHGTDIEEYSDLPSLKGGVPLWRVSRKKIRGAWDIEVCVIRIYDDYIDLAYDNVHTIPSGRQILNIQATDEAHALKKAIDLFMQYDAKVGTT